MVMLGATGGFFVSRAALPARARPEGEATMLAQALDDLPWGSPAAGLTAMLDSRPPGARVR